MLKKDKTELKFFYGMTPEEDAYYKTLIKVKGKDEEPSLAKSVLNVLNGPGQEIHRLAFETDPTAANTYAGVYKQKMRLLPDSVLKRIAIQDSLVSNIVRARQNHVKAFGRPRPDVYSTGFIIAPNTGVTECMTEDERIALDKEIKEAVALLNTCGHTEGVKDHHQKTFSEYLELMARDSQVVGRIASEIVHTEDVVTGEKKFHYFCYTDAGTIYPAAPSDNNAKQALRDEALDLLRLVTGDKNLQKETWNRNNEYNWIQVIDGRPQQAFTNEEMKCRNFYPAGNVELDGFPVTPIDTVITAITTHLNITTHNKVYFQNGRASRGMIIIKSDDVTPTVIHNIKQQMNASIVGAEKSWRMPVLGFGSETEVTWQPIDQSGSRDMEFQYLTDLNAREILTAFLMSPDELPGWSYLSRGTNSQALSECVAPYTRILTKEGLKAIADVVGQAEEKRIKIWNGEEWVAGRAFKSGQKKLVQTKFSGNYSIDTSPDHRFRIIGPEGIPIWKHQSELKIGDFVLVNKKPVQAMANIPTYKGKPLTLGMMEVLGWMTGDGSFNAPRNRTGAQLQLFYHHEKERDIWNKHAQVLKDFGFDTVHQYEYFRTPEKREELSIKRCIDSTAESYIKTSLYDTEFYNWLISLGFSKSSRTEVGKTIPAVFHVMPIEYRQAFLRGLFSADGGKLNERGSVALTIQNDRLRDQVQQLLLSLGIRTLSAKGVLRSGFGKEKTFSYKLFIKDREEYWKQIGFIQDFKQLQGSSQKWSIVRPPKTVVEQIFGEALKTYTPKMLKQHRDGLISFLHKNKSLTWQRMISLADQYNIPVPQWIRDYNVEEVVELNDLNQTINMFDVETFDDKHQFVADGIVTHNSNSEYKLTAARDVGMRPLIAGFEDFINDELFPLIAPKLCKICRVKLVGLDAESPEKEIVGLQQNSQVHMTYNDILQKKEKKPLPKHMCGDIPLNPGYQKLLDAYKTVGEIREYFLGIPGASKDPRWDYCRDPMYFQNIQLQMQQQQMQMQQDQMAQQAQMQQMQPPPSNKTPDEQEDPNKEQDSGPEDLARSIDQAYELMSKSEENLTPNQRRLLVKQQQTLKFAIDGFKHDTKDAIDAILDEVKNLSIKK